MDFCASKLFSLSRLKAAKPALTPGDDVELVAVDLLTTPPLWTVPLRDLEDVTALVDDDVAAAVTGPVGGAATAGGTTITTFFGGLATTGSLSSLSSSSSSSRSWCSFSSNSLIAWDVAGVPMSWGSMAKSGEGREGNESGLEDVAGDANGESWGRAERKSKGSLGCWWCGFERSSSRPKLKKDGSRGGERGEEEEKRSRLRKSEMGSNAANGGWLSTSIVVVVERNRSRRDCGVTDGIT